MVHAVLRNKGLVGNITPPVSAGLLVDTARYFAALETFRKGNARPIVECFADACRFAATTGTRLIDDLDEQLSVARDRLHGVRKDAAVWKVLPLLIEQPIINREYLIRKIGLSPMSARRAIDTLAKRGIVVQTMGGRRNAVWEHKGILSVLDEYGTQYRRT